MALPHPYTLDPCSNRNAIPSFGTTNKGPGARQKRNVWCPRVPCQVFMECQTSPCPVTGANCQPGVQGSQAFRSSRPQPRRMIGANGFPARPLSAFYLRAGAAGHQVIPPTYKRETAYLTSPRILLFKKFTRNINGVQLRLFQRLYKMTNPTYPSC